MVHVTATNNKKNLSSTKYTARSKVTILKYRKHKSTCTLAHVMDSSRKSFNSIKLYISLMYTNKTMNMQLAAPFVCSGLT